MGDGLWGNPSICSERSMTKEEKFVLFAHLVALLLIVAGVTAIWLKWGTSAGVITLLVSMILSRVLFSNNRTNED